MSKTQSKELEMFRMQLQNMGYPDHIIEAMIQAMMKDGGEIKGNILFVKDGLVLSELARDRESEKRYMIRMRLKNWGFPDHLIETYMPTLTKDFMEGIDAILMVMGPTDVSRVLKKMKIKINEN